MPAYPIRVKTTVCVPLSLVAHLNVHVRRAFLAANASRTLASRVHAKMVAHALLCPVALFHVHVPVATLAVLAK